MDVIPIIHCGDEHEYRLKNFIPLNLTGMENPTPSSAYCRLRRRSNQSRMSRTFLISAAKAASVTMMSLIAASYPFRLFQYRRSLSTIFLYIPIALDDFLHRDRMNSSWIYVFEFHLISTSKSCKIRCAYTKPVLSYTCHFGSSPKVVLDCF